MQVYGRDFRVMKASEISALYRGLLNNEINTTTKLKHFARYSTDVKLLEHYFGENYEETTDKFKNDRTKLISLLGVLNGDS